MVSILIFPAIAFLFTTISFIINTSHFLISLLCLEGIILSIVVFFPSVTTVITASIPASALILLTFGACEASLGLRILVKMSRHYGSDTISNLALNKC